MIISELTILYSDFCTNGYYSNTGLEECTPCPNGTFTNDYKSQSCQPCTADDVEQPECKGMTKICDTKAFL